MKRVAILSFLIALLLPRIAVKAQETSAVSLPLNSSVSGIGTSFGFGPSPICSGCLEGEIGFLSLNDFRAIGLALTVSPLNIRNDLTILWNAVESQESGNERTTELGNRLDFIMRQELFNGSGFILSIAPRAALFMNSGGERFGGTLTAQYGWCSNIFLVNANLTKAIQPSDNSPNWDYQFSVDYGRILGREGLAVFFGAQHGFATHNDHYLNIEQGVIWPFRDGQLELAVAQMDATRDFSWQFQIRTIVNFGKMM